MEHLERDKEGDEKYVAPRVSLKIQDFDILGRLGDGSFSTVVLARLRVNPEGDKFAIKIVNKHLVLRNKMFEYVRNERNIMDALNHDSIVRLRFTFQDQSSLYFGCEYCPGGDLYEQIQKRGAFPLEDTKFYAAEVVQMLEYLKSKQVVHRDLKPENLLLTESGHLKLTDFGSAKAFFLPPIGGPGRQSRTTSFVGTAEYVSPEVLHNQPLSYPADLWALGCIIFQLLSGKPPFKAASEYLSFQKVTDVDYTYPEAFPAVAKDLVDKLLVVDPDERLGASDLQDLKRHEFFAGVDWGSLRSQKAPSYIPPPTPTVEEEALDWELSSIVRSSMDRPAEASDNTAAAEPAKGSSLAGTTHRGEQQQQQRYQLEQKLQGFQGLGEAPHHEELSLDTGIIYEKVDRGSSDGDDDDDDSDGSGRD
uniref:non-specific serine/threonine protein kinase n=1 Tax=Dunaliella tertiolecta TaxID=3047 RepID=A0A7S3R3C7_DUNTE|mmetsp:Transcript_23531/g.64868  ORF Transcript_23531/g.64868 Transcript_23531/m.64868 type:complete len:420 (+) Transcript_23531:66-1325(+)|eukprot:CAMPEP_0202342870 /NCGR_PEP_ID=MMETSP1126-20121109/3248_1 /ASSEMBLY_ACC=CAM_ASM_000457 /TAXON_ID=3047 /ORGANISM="Dunaliella tertiolecta, Strain CCMP1320" /LENGTH=419 /DNA_ID=CAMNT_0048933885 /DNA_START=29 /DNA_END=1288 /DNA_ORIENTATION=-